MPRMLYTNDAIGRRTAREDSGSAFALTQANAFVYNLRSEVTEATMQNGLSKYEYDPIGNRKKATLPEEQVPLVYAANPLNQYTSITGPINPVHDDDGNMLDDGDGMVMEWDAENRLTKTVKGGQTVTYTYDYMSRRVAKTVGTTTYTYLYDGWNLIRETIINQQSKIENHYVWGLDLSQSMQGAGGVGGLLAAVHGANVYYPCFDANGNITQYVNSSSGTEVARYDYDAFGREFHSSGTMVDDFVFRFSTKYTDNETGLVYYGYRLYNPELGRWINRDPIDEEGGINLSVSANNNLFNRIDHLGLVTIDIPLLPPVEVPIPTFPRIPDPRNWRPPQIPRIRLPRIPRPSLPSQVCVARELFSGYRQMRDANWIGADKWFHCMAMCRAARNCGNPDFTDTMGILRELADLTKGRFDPPTHPDGTPLTPIEQAKDSLEDMEANRTGINCPPSQSCKCCCEKYVPSGFDTDRWMN